MKKLTKTEINLKLLNKYKASLEQLNYDVLKTFREKVKTLSNERKKTKLSIKYEIL